MIINGWYLVSADLPKPSPVKYYPPHQRNHPKILNSNCQYIGVTETQHYPGTPLRYQARIKIAGKSKSLGSFPDMRAAALARDSHIIKNNLLGYKMNEFNNLRK